MARSKVTVTYKDALRDRKTCLNVNIRGGHEFRVRMAIAKVLIWIAAKAIWCGVKFEEGEHAD
jgi:hypothetical protein